MEVIYASIFFGMVFAAVLILFFVLGRGNVPDDSDMDGDTATIVLQNLQLSLSRGERQAIDYAIDSIRIRQKLEEYFERGEQHEKERQ